MVSRMIKSTPTSLRNATRHSHIGIRLQLHAHEQWERIEALGWNEVGFNFFHIEDIHEPSLQLKRSLTRFAGTIVWRARSSLDDVILAALVNELIFAQANDMTDNQLLHSRLMNLIRAPGMLAEKRKILASLGLTLTDTEIEALIQQRKQDRPIYQFGVKVDSEAWRSLVKNALSISSVVISLEKWSSSLVKI